MTIFIFVFQKSFSILLFLLLYLQLLSFILHVLAWHRSSVLSEGISLQRQKKKKIHPIKRYPYGQAPLQSNVVSGLPVIPLEDCYMKCCTLKAQICLLLQFHSSNHCLLQHNYSNTVLSMKIHSIWKSFISSWLLLSPKFKASPVFQAKLIHYKLIILSCC